LSRELAPDLADHSTLKEPLRFHALIIPHPMSFVVEGPGNLTAGIFGIQALHHVDHKFTG